MKYSTKEKTKIAILGTGNIGCDLLVKITKSKYLDCVLFAGQREDSPGIAFAKGLKVPTSTKSIEAVLGSEARIVFDCTSAAAHRQNAPRLRQKGIFTIDLTPAKIGMICVPSITPLKGKCVNMGSCTVQAVLPKLAKIKDLEYVEVVTTIASDSAGMGTRENISEYMQTTTKAIEEITGAKAKVILIINPVLQAMHNTIYYRTKHSDEVKIMQFEVKGSGDYLDKRFGNLDIMTLSALHVAEDYAKNIRFNT